MDEEDGGGGGVWVLEGHKGEVHQVAWHPRAGREGTEGVRLIASCVAVLSFLVFLLSLLTLPALPPLPLLPSLAFPYVSPPSIPSAISPIPSPAAAPSTTPPDFGTPTRVGASTPSLAQRTLFTPSRLNRTWGGGWRRGVTMGGWRFGKCRCVFSFFAFLLSFLSRCIGVRCSPSVQLQSSGGSEGGPLTWLSPFPFSYPSSTGPLPRPRVYPLDANLRTHMAPSRLADRRLWRGTRRCGGRVRWEQQRRRRGEEREKVA